MTEDQMVEYRSDAALDSRADVEHCEGVRRLFRLVEDQQIGVNNVCEISEVPLGLEVADPDGRGAARLEAGELGGKAGNNKTFVLAGTRVIEQAQSDHRQLLSGKIT